MNNQLVTNKTEINKYDSCTSLNQLCDEHIQASAMIKLERAIAGLAVSSGYVELDIESFLASLSAVSTADHNNLLSKGVAPILLADLDGTLIKDPSGIAVVREYIRRELVLDDVLPALNKLLTLFEAPQTADVNTGAADLLYNYSEWVVHKKETDPDAMHKTQEFYAFCAYIFAGRTEEWLREFAVEVFNTYNDTQNSRGKQIFEGNKSPKTISNNFWSKTFKGSREMLKKFYDKGIQTAIISASPNAVVQVIGQHLGIESQMLQGVQVAKDSTGKLLPYLDAPLPFREGKVFHARRIIAKIFGDSNLQPLFAIGDTPAKTDANMLESARLTLVAEPQTTKDAQRAIELSNNGHGVIVVRFSETVSGEMVGEQIAI